MPRCLGLCLIREKIIFTNVQENQGNHRLRSFLSMLDKGNQIPATNCWGSSVASDNFPRVHLFSISNEASGWSMGTMCPASWTCWQRHRATRLALIIKWKLLFMVTKMEAMLYGRNGSYGLWTKWKLLFFTERGEKP